MQGEANGVAVEPQVVVFLFFCVSTETWRDGGKLSSEISVKKEKSVDLRWVPEHLLHQEPRATQSSA